MEGGRRPPRARWLKDDGYDIVDCGPLVGPV
jgi:hypothetical protein